MKYWCTKHEEDVTKDEAEGRCLKENNHKGCVNLTKKRRENTSGPKPLPKHQPDTGEMPIRLKAPDKMDFLLYQQGLLPINSNTGEGTIIKQMIDDQWQLFECLKSAQAKVGLILRNGMTIEGWLYKTIGEGHYKLRVKIGEPSDGSRFGGVFKDTWLRQVIAVKFELATDFKSLGFKPYEKKVGLYYDTSRAELSEIEGDLFWDTYDLASYLLHGSMLLIKLELR